MTTFSEAIETISQALGLPLECDENGCTLLIENRYSLNIRHDEAGERILLSGAVADAMPEPISPFVVETLLECSLEHFLTGSPAVGLDRESGILAAYAALPMAAMNSEECTAALFKFLEFQVTISEMISMNAGAPDQAEHGHAGNNDSWVKA